MAYTNGINPYSGFDFTNVPSMVSLLKEQGYHTIAMHPENPGNWRRSIVYPKLGFDEFLSIVRLKTVNGLYGTGYLTWGIIRN